MAILQYKTKSVNKESISSCRKSTNKKIILPPHPHITLFFLSVAVAFLVTGGLNEKSDINANFRILGNDHFLRMPASSVTVGDGNSLGENMSKIWLD